MNLTEATREELVEELAKRDGVEKYHFFRLDRYISPGECDVLVVHDE